MKNMFLPYANKKGADQPAHPRSLISTFVVRCRDSMIPLLAIAETSRLQLVSVAEHAGLSLTLSETPKKVFSWRGSFLKTVLPLNNFGMD